MSGIASVLNIAKQAILAHQVSIEVGGHNVANVDTAGYSRQALELKAAQPYPSVAGLVGSGVQAEYIYRYYDQFMTSRIMDQQSTSSNLKAQEETHRLVETQFNEAPGLAVNDLLNAFWTSWQEISDNPEMLSSRQMTVQQAELLVNKLHSMDAEVAQTRYDIGVSITASIDKINELTGQLAQLNVEITSAESDKYTANDLRDTRDQMLKDLAGLVDVNYFETKSGSYTILLPDGHPLVETNENWEVDWLDDSLLWISERRNKLNQIEQTTSTIASGADVGGKVGGMMEIFSELKANDPTNYLGRLDAFANALIREINQQHSQGAGLIKFSGEVTGSELAENTATLTTQLSAATATTTIDSGTLIINDREVGKIAGGVAVNGRATIKAYNAVTAINKALAGVTAKLTTQVAGSPVNPAGPPALANGDQISFDINGVTVNYTVSIPGDDVAATLAANLADGPLSAINAAITAYNASSANTPDVTIEAVVGDGTNGGAMNSIVFRNTNPGDESQIVISNIVGIPAGIEATFGLTAGTYEADATNNTGEITLFSDDAFTVEAGVDDTYLDHFGWSGGGLSTTDIANDGRFTRAYSDGGSQYNLQGYKYADELVTDGGSFDLWFYNTDGTLAYNQAVTVAIDRAYDLQDIVVAINDAVVNQTGNSWLTATISSDNALVLTGDVDHEFAFANDTSNFLQVAGINTFFSGHDAASIEVNSIVKDNVNFLAAATVTQYGEIFRGDNSNALRITDIQRDDDVSFIGGQNNTIDGFYNSLVGDIGIKGQSLERDIEYNDLLTDQMNALRDSVSGVSLDEEMANLIKYQHAFASAAKFIGVSDEMLLTLLETV